MSLLDNIVEYPDIFHVVQVKRLFKTALESKSWGFQTSLNESVSEANHFLRLDLNPYGEIITTLFPSILDRTKINFKIIDVYLNGQFFGMPGLPHYDDIGEDKYTFLVYLNPVWKDDWGGKTIFLDKYAARDRSFKTEITKNSDESKAIYPKNNLGLLFPSKIIHYAEAPTQNCKELRITLAFKLIRR